VKGSGIDPFAFDIVFVKSCRIRYRTHTLWQLSTLKRRCVKQMNTCRPLLEVDRDHQFLRREGDSFHCFSTSEPINEVHTHRRKRETILLVRHCMLLEIQVVRT
jgi:hypothetical protein